MDNIEIGLKQLSTFPEQDFHEHIEPVIQCQEMILRISGQSSV